MAPKRAIQFERIRAHVAAGILGVEVRTVQALAARGDLPGAAKIGGLWTFDEAALRQWIKEREAKPDLRKPSQKLTSTKWHTGGRTSLDAARTKEAYEAMLARLRRLK
jgi:excisionase family DNA binding protein